MYTLISIPVTPADKPFIVYAGSFEDTMSHLRFKIGSGQSFLLSFSSVENVSDADSSEA